MVSRPSSPTSRRRVNSASASTSEELADSNNPAEVNNSSNKFQSRNYKPAYPVPRSIGGWRGILLTAIVVVASATVLIVAPIILPTPNGPDYIAVSVVFFLLLMLTEIIITRGTVYDMADSAGSVSAGSFQQLFSVILMKKLGMGYIPYTWVYTHYRLAWSFELNSWQEWIAIVLAIDFAYYWFHRASHEFQPFWWGHVVHHSSEFFNLSTALRQGVLQTPFSAICFLPLALLFPPKLYLIQSQLNTLYQFWVHTQCIGKLGPLEWIFMTPSGHRVHHDRRVHKNYGGFLVIWDRMFGSYTEELVEEGKRGTIYGVLNTPNSWNPAYVQSHQLLFTLKRMSQMQGLRAKLRVLFSGPGARSMSSRTQLPLAPENAPNHRYRTIMSKRQVVYCLVHLGAAVVMVNLCMAWQDPPLVTMLAVALAGLISLTSIGMLNDKSPHAVTLELVRTLTIAAACILTLASKQESLVPTPVLYGGAVLFSLSAALVVCVPAMFTENYIRTY